MNPLNASQSTVCGLAWKPYSRQTPLPDVAPALVTVPIRTRAPGRLLPVSPLHLLGKDAPPGCYFFECPLDERVFAFAALCWASLFVGTSPPGTTWKANPRVEKLLKFTEVRASRCVGRCSGGRSRPPGRERPVLLFAFCTTPNVSRRTRRAAELPPRQRC